MKLATKSLWVSALVAVLMLAGCASTPITVDSKYVFPQFEQVDKFTSFSLNSWQPIDNQSLIVQTGPNRNYLLVLKHPLYDLRYAEAIEVSKTGASVRAKFDCVKVRNGRCGPNPIKVSIHSIYKLQGREQVRAARQQILPER